MVYFGIETIGDRIYQSPTERHSMTLRFTLRRAIG
jgi:hypothetical protein